MSLIAAVQGRYSDAVLSQVYKLEQKDSEKNELVSKKDSCKIEKMVTFRRNELFFMGRKSVMLNLRDVTQEQIHSQEVNQKPPTDTFGHHPNVVQYKRPSSEVHLLVGIDNGNSLLACGAVD